MSARQPDEFFQYHLKTEAVSDQYGAAVMLTQQDGIDDPVTILVHPWQLRAACEHLGILQTDPEASRQLSRLMRRIRVLAARVGQLNDRLRSYAETEAASLMAELPYAQATADLAAEFLADLESADAAEPEQRELL